MTTAIQMALQWARRAVPHAPSGPRSGEPPAATPVWFRRAETQALSLMDLSRGDGESGLGLRIMRAASTIGLMLLGVTF